MKNLAIFGLAAASASFAVGSLWNMTVDAYQVQTPEVVNCMSTAVEQAEKDACYESTGGWWFAYTGDTKDGQVMTFSPISENPDGTPLLITTDKTDGSIVDNGNLQEGAGLVVTMSAANGAESTPAIAGIGVNWTAAETPVDISDKTGFCLAYSWTGTKPLLAELSQGAAADKAAEYNTWTASIAPATGGTANLTWDKFKNGGDNWGKPATLDAVKSSFVAIKILIKNQAATKVEGTLTVSELGWAGECGAGGSGTPSTGIHAVAASSAKATLSGRTLSFSGINSAATYEIVSLQGQVVKSGVVSSSINLSSLNAGVYMVRVAGKSVNMNQKILVK